MAAKGTRIADYTRAQGQSRWQQAEAFVMAADLVLSDEYRYAGRGRGAGGPVKTKLSGLASGLDPVALAGVWFPYAERQVCLWRDPLVGAVVAESSFREQPLDRFLELVASNEPAPGGGSVAAVAAALAAGLVAMAGRFSSGHLEDAAGIVREADGLRQEALALADRDAFAYGAVRDAYALPKDANPDDRRRRIRVALERATDVPLEVARVATRAAILGSRLVHGGNPNLKGDAVTAILLAKAAARGAVTLVEVNVRLGKLDGDWLDRSAVYLAAAGDACGVA